MTPERRAQNREASKRYRERLRRSGRNAHGHKYTTADPTWRIVAEQLRTEHPGIYAVLRKRALEQLERNEQ